MAKSCLVTGGAGFIGCAISEKLCQHFDRVVALDNLHPQVHPNKIRPLMLYKDVELIIGDISVADTWDNLLNNFKPDVVIHLAAETGTGQSLTHSSRHATSNVLGTTQMLDALFRFGYVPERFVLSSSRAVYGEGAWIDLNSGGIKYPGHRTASDLEKQIWGFDGLEYCTSDASVTNPKPSNVYASTKLAQEHILQAWTDAFASSLCILRFQNVFGPGQSLHNPYTGIVQIFSQAARQLQVIPVYEDGQIVRDFVFVDDVADLIVKAATGQKKAGVFDVGSGTETTVLQLASLIASEFGAPQPIVTGQFRHGDVRHAACSIQRTKDAFEWEPKYELLRGLEILWDWMQNP